MNWNSSFSFVNSFICSTYWLYRIIRHLFDVYNVRYRSVITALPSFLHVLNYAWALVHQKVILCRLHHITLGRHLSPAFWTLYDALLSRSQWHLIAVSRSICDSVFREFSSECLPAICTQYCELYTLCRWKYLIPLCIFCRPGSWISCTNVQTTTSTAEQHFEDVFTYFFYPAESKHIKIHLPINYNYISAYFQDVEF
jgi:hypothetical protein